MIEKILKKIHEDQDGLMDAQGNFEYPEHEGAYNALGNLKEYIKSLVKESVSKGLEDAGANWQKEQLIDKACEWLLNNIRYYSTNALGAEYLCKDFRKAMEYLIWKRK